MRRILLSLSLFLLPALTTVACSGGSSGGGGVTGSVVASSLKDASRADLTGQESAFTGTLGSGASFTFPAIKGQSYFIQAQLDDVDDQIVLEFAGDDGAGLKSRTVDHNETYQYTHEGKTQHVLVLVRPRNPFNTSVGVRSLTITATGAFPDNAVHLNFVVAGKHAGFGLFGDMTTTADQAAFTNAVMTKVQSHFSQIGISVSYEGFSYTSDQVKAVHPELIGPDDQALCAAGESMSGSGFELVEKQGLDAWGDLGFDEGDSNFNRGHGINVFLVHHFTNDGTVGLSPRPGVLVGKGRDTALCAATFVKQGNVLTPRTVDELALVITHEVGHFLGLLHTTTFTPSPTNATEAVDDGILDTPKCTITNDVNGDGRVGIGDGCPDESNIMFYQADAGLQTVLTAGQAKIMRNLLSLQEH